MPFGESRTRSIPSCPTTEIGPNKTRGDESETDRSSKRSGPTDTEPPSASPKVMATPASASSFPTRPECPIRARYARPRGPAMAAEIEAHPGSVAQLCGPCRFKLTRYRRAAPDVVLVGSSALLRHAWSRPPSRRPTSARMTSSGGAPLISTTKGAVAQFDAASSGACCSACCTVRTRPTRCVKRINRDC
jgi:hypothetical protein